MSQKPLASLSLDLDNKWSYLKVRGNPAWQDFPGYLDLVVPRIVNFLDARQLRMTCFVVGQDAALRENHDPIAMLAEAGHEIGNHSFNHEPWLHLYDDAQLKDEFDRTESAIEKITGQRPVGFRGPGFSCSQDVLRMLMRRGYLYDGSTFPTSLGPVARAYYFLSTGLSKNQREQRKELFGSFSDAFQQNRPFVWTHGDQRLVEIPVTTMPGTRFPIHASYLNYLGSMSTSLAKAYFWKAMNLCWLVGTSPSLLLHPTDFLGKEDDSDMSFFPGMGEPSFKKLQLLSDCLEMMERRFEIVPMQQQAEQVLRSSYVTRSIAKAVPGVAGGLANAGAR